MRMRKAFSEGGAFGAGVGGRHNVFTSTLDAFLEKDETKQEELEGLALLTPKKIMEEKIIRRSIARKVSRHKKKNENQ